MDKPMKRTGSTKHRVDPLKMADLLEKGAKDERASGPTRVKAARTARILRKLDAMEKRKAE